MHQPDLTAQQRRDLTGARPWRIPLDGADWPNRRFITALNARWPLAGRRVLELGCFQGHITAQVAQLGAIVTALEPRPQNLTAAFERCVYHGCQAGVRFLLGDSRSIDLGLVTPGEFDLLLHCGVLYHLADPVSHLRAVVSCFPVVALETHVLVRERIANASCLVPGDVDCHGYRGRRYREGGWEALRAGLERHSTWLYEEELHRLCRSLGYGLFELQRHAAAPIAPRCGWLLTTTRTEGT